jgi:hypothetical protein
MKRPMEKLAVASRVVMLVSAVAIHRRGEKAHALGHVVVGVACLAAAVHLRHRNVD